MDIINSKNVIANVTFGNIGGNVQVGDDINLHFANGDVQSFPINEIKDRIREDLWAEILEKSKGKDFFEKIAEAIRKPKKFLAPPTVPVPITFLGRKEELAEIRKRLTIGNTLALINGEGGIGKTSLAAKYWEHYKGNYQHAAWLFCDSGILNSLITLLSFPLGIDLKELKTREEQINAIRSGMGNLPKDCLLVLDNANKEDDINDFLEEFRGIGWHILFTSRCQKVMQNEYYISGLPKDLAQKHFKVSFTTVFEFAEIMNLFEQYNQGNLGSMQDEIFDTVLNALFEKHAPKNIRLPKTTLLM
jgi:hypothetical protein